MVSRWGLIRWIRRATGVYGRPNFFIVGAQKSGTTSLWECLFQHPCVLFRAKKEVHYWEGRNYDASLQWYESHFPGWLEKKIRAGARSGPLLSGEATPVMGNGTNAPTRLREAYPNLRILVMLRNPVQRAYSHYKHLRRHHPENVPQSFREALEEVKDITNANHGLKNHVAAGGLKKVLDAFPQKPPLATWIATLRSLRSTCSSANAPAASKHSPSARAITPGLRSPTRKCWRSTCSGLPKSAGAFVRSTTT